MEWPTIQYAIKACDHMSTTRWRGRVRLDKYAFACTRAMNAAATHAAHLVSARGEDTPSDDTLRHQQHSSTANPFGSIVDESRACSAGFVSARERKSVSVSATACPNAFGERAESREEHNTQTKSRRTCVASCARTCAPWCIEHGVGLVMVWRVHPVVVPYPHCALANERAPERGGSSLRTCRSPFSHDE